MISQRVRDAVTDVEHQSWRAVAMSGKALLPYLASDCVMLFPDGRILGRDTKPSLKQNFESDTYRTYASYNMEDIRVVEVGMMAAAITYRLTAAKTPREGKKSKRFTAVASSMWRQEASGDWKLCVHQMTPL